MLYGSNKGQIQRGTKMYDVRTGPSTAYHYTDEVIENETIGTGDGATAHFVGNLAWVPVRPGTIRFEDGTQRVVDDGNHNLVGNVNAAGTNTIQYDTGAYDFTFAAASANGEAVVASYEYNAEANATLPEIDLQLTMAPVTARSQKLRARWSQFEAPCQRKLAA